MASEKYAKVAILAVSAIVLLIYIIWGNMPQYGICVGSDALQRFSYHFLHSSLLHALINVWCLLSVGFVYRISLGVLLTAYILASLFPVDTLQLLLPYSNGFLLPTVGLSGICYALMGVVAFQVQRKVYYHLWLAFYIGIGFLFPNVNGWIHLYCYIAGLGVGLLTESR